MKRYRVQTIDRMPESWSVVEKVEISSYLWRKGYAPRVTAAAVYVKNKGFAVHMTCAEQKPRVTFFTADSPVWEDSCMEFFANFAPEKSGAYINMEANAAGTLCCGFGNGRKQRVRVATMPVACPTAEAVVSAESWSCEFFIPLETIAFMFGKSEFKKGDIIRGNFYKCGDKTEAEHYGCWSVIETPLPDFHRPEFFGELIID